MENTNKIDYILQHINSLLTRDSDQIILEQLGIGYSQYKILRILVNGMAVKQKFIADTLGQTEASISRQIDILIDKVLITKQVDRHNRRNRLITITPKGRKIAEATKLVLAKYHQTILADISDKKQADLLKLLEELHGKVCQNDHSTDMDYVTYLSQT
jgi:DNA-binding MarR family transcriptional regulator